MRNLLYLELARLTFINLTIIARKSFRMPQRREREVIIKFDQTESKHKEQKPSAKPGLYFLEQQRF